MVSSGDAPDLQDSFAGMVDVAGVGDLSREAFSSLLHGRSASAEQSNIVKSIIYQPPNVLRRRS